MEELKKGRGGNSPSSSHCLGLSQRQTLPIPVLALINASLNCLSPLIKGDKTLVNETLVHFCSFPQDPHLWFPEAADGSSWGQAGLRVNYSLVYCPVRPPFPPTPLCLVLLACFTLAYNRNTLFA